MRRLLVLGAALVLCAGCAASQSAPLRKAAAPALRGHAVREPTRAPDLALHDQDGRLVRLSAQRGRLVLLTFLYTNCPDICPLIAGNLNAAVRSLPPASRRDVRILAVSIDPLGDTPWGVRRFIHEHGLLPQFRYLSGTRPQLAPVWQAWNILVEPRSPERVGHSALVWLIDRDGRARASYAASVTPATIAHDLRALSG